MTKLEDMPDHELVLLELKVWKEILSASSTALDNNPTIGKIAHEHINNIIGHALFLAGEIGAILDKHKMNTILEASIKILDLSYRIHEIFKQEEIEIIGDLIQLTRNDLLKIPNLGKKSVNELINALWKISDTLRLRRPAESLKSFRDKMGFKKISDKGYI